MSHLHTDELGLNNNSHVQMIKTRRVLITNFMVIISVAREVSFQGFLFKVTKFTLELFNVIFKPRDLWTIYHNPCFKRGMLVKNVSI